MPISIWNDRDYDEHAIYTGSAAVVAGAAPDGVGAGVVQIYPGLCAAERWPACSTGTVLAQAVPASEATAMEVQPSRAIARQSAAYVVVQSVAQVCSVLSLASSSWGDDEWSSP